MTTRKNHKDTGGFTLVEMLIATTVFGVIIGAALGFMTVQNRAFNVGSDRMFILQNLRYASQALEMDLRTLGSNVPAGQPSMILADDDVIVFSADHTSNVRDYTAVYYDPDAPDGMVQAPRTAVSLPNSSYSWPDTVYEALGGAPSGAEMLVFSFQPDISTDRTDDFVLMRQVNDSTPEVLARDLLKQGSTPFFRYFRRRVYTSLTSLDSIPDDELPLFHWEPIHGSAGDTAMSAKVDSIRAVRVSLRATNGRTGDDERFIDLSRVVDLPNSGIEIAGACGDEPILGGDLMATVVGSSSGSSGSGTLTEGDIQAWVLEIEGVMDSDPDNEDLIDKLEDVTENLLADAIEKLREGDQVGAQGKVDDAIIKVKEAIDEGLGAPDLLTQILDRLTGGGYDGPPYVHLEWAPSVDEESGEKDVTRYLIYRREVSFGAAWGSPLASIPAGADEYYYDDMAVEIGGRYQYTYAAQDCTPSLSPLAALQQVNIY